ncbi:MAG TPA: hypothetical protein PKY77_26170 [Phycisphaerae bacterium]|nr:hypothetical protein [Phycisphaerae bacterium]HRY67697.1 hypothetical protein [Phycisphaerae bacterium]HSA25148.1 hypothetical protein [Phycisphaerae bacterium]
MEIHEPSIVEVLTMQKQKPAHVVRFGRIKAAIWANQSPSGCWYSVQVCRVYRDGQNEWRQSDSFGRDDLPLVCKAMDRAHTWIYEQARPSTNGMEAVAPPDVAASELS